MKTESIKTYSPNFGMIYIPRESNMSENLIKAIKRSPAVRKFGRRYNATLGIQHFSSTSVPGRINYGLIFENIKPSNPITALLSLFRGNKNGRYICYNSGKDTKEGLIHILERLKKNTFINLYNQR